MTKHTPTPWKTFPHPDKDCGCVGIGDQNSYFEASHTTCYLNPIHNAAFIVRACNAHEELVEALKMAQNNLQIREGRARPRQKSWEGAKLDEKINAILAKVKGDA